MAIIQVPRSSLRIGGRQLSSRCQHYLSIIALSPTALQVSFDEGQYRPRRSEAPVAASGGHTCLLFPPTASCTPHAIRWLQGRPGEFHLPSKEQDRQAHRIGPTACVDVGRGYRVRVDYGIDQAAHAYLVLPADTTIANQPLSHLE